MPQRQVHEGIDKAEAAWCQVLYAAKTRHESASPRRWGRHTFAVAYGLRALGSLPPGPAPAGSSTSEADIATTVGWFARHWFVAGLILAAGLAFIIPEVGARAGPLRPEITTKVGVGLIFLMQGLSIATAALRSGALRWRLHVAMQLFMFAAFPAGMILLDRAVGGLLPEDLRMGFLFLAILPTTVSTCVVLTGTAGGNVSGALFNSAFANVAGVIITPVWAAFLLQARGEGPAMLPLVAEIAALLLLPLAAGQALRAVLRHRRLPDVRVLSALSNGIILYIVFTALANSVNTGAFAETGLGLSALVAGGVVLLFAAASAAAWAVGGLFRFKPGDRRAFLFTAPQKTLAAGAPMGQILFAGHPGLGLILLPLMVYHVVQLLAGATLAERLHAASSQE
jgi:solute carrier family 10 (sodium/bile acid cotransporter), member 7